MQVTHDLSLDVALGNSRTTKVWKNRTLTWSELLDRLAAVTRTPETVAEYRSMPRSKQADIKDVGGFVGGYVNNGRRSDVRHRSLICLDADFADAGLWPDWLLLMGHAAAVYSTHKHTPDKPRLRLVIPLTRNVSPDEYQAVGRKIAQILGIDKFDDTTYQAERVMYWPSCSLDGEFVFNHCDGPVVNPDDVLAEYHDWHDVSAWPVSSRQAEVIRKTGAKQGDPLEKPGIVGAFCRAYFPVSEAIEAFAVPYAPCDTPGRYTYTEGSTAAGVIVYDDKFTFSHHGTDPTSGQLVNAWDLVRLHKFRDRDDDSQDAHGSSLPSYRAMADLAKADPRVRRQLVEDRQAQAAATTADFDTLPDQGDDSGDWKASLRITDKGGIAQTIENTVIILQHDPILANRLALNELDHQIVVRDDLPWRKATGTPWTDADDAALRFYLEKTYGLSGKDRIFDAVNVVATSRKFHPVRDYLRAQTWDGVPRVETLLVDFLGAEDTPYTRAVTRKALVAAVARVMRPGCKFDYMLTLRGRQGLGKSALIAKLGGPWFSDTFSTLQGKEAYEQLMGAWIVEVGELAGMRKAEAETIKLYISKQSDRFRPAYGRRLQEFPRQCIFIGTTNESEFLRDATGNRRFWIVDTPHRPARDLWHDLTPETVGQVWAEAFDIYGRGEDLYLPRELERVAQRIQAAHEEDNPRAGIVMDYLDRLLPEGWDKMDTYARRAWLESDAVGTVQRDRVCVLEIWAEALNGNPERLDRYAVKEIGDIMAGLPWIRVGAERTRFGPYGRQRYYKRRS